MFLWIFIWLQGSFWSVFSNVSNASMDLLYLPLAQQHSAGDVAGIHRSRSSVIGRPPFQQPKYATTGSVLKQRCRWSVMVMLFGSSKRQFFCDVIEEVGTYFSDLCLNKRPNQNDNIKVHTYRDEWSAALPFWLFLSWQKDKGWQNMTMVELFDSKVMSPSLIRKQVPSRSKILMRLEDTFYKPSC